MSSTAPPTLSADTPVQPHALWVIAGTALAYVLAALPALQLLAIPPGYASPLYPPAGIALAAVLVYGRVAMLGAALVVTWTQTQLAWARD